MKKNVLALVLILGAIALTGCKTSEKEVALDNVSMTEEITEETTNAGNVDTSAETTISENVDTAEETTISENVDAAGETAKSNEPVSLSSLGYNAVEVGYSDSEGATNLSFIKYASDGENIGGLAGFITDDGNVIVLPEGYASGFNDGLAVAGTYVGDEDPRAGSYGSIFGYIDTTGEYVIEQQYAEASRFSGGIAIVRINNESATSEEDSSRVAVIDTTGKELFELPTDVNINSFDEREGFNEGVICTGGKVYLSDGTVNDISETLVNITGDDYYQDYSFVNGFTSVKGFRDNEDNYYTYIIDTNGSINEKVLNAFVESISEDGKYIAGEYLKTSYRKIGKEKALFELDNRDVRIRFKFYDGLVSASKVDDDNFATLGYVDEQGKEAIDFKYSYGYAEDPEFHHGRCAVRLVDLDENGDDTEEGYYILIDTTGKVIIGESEKANYINDANCGKFVGAKIDTGNDTEETALFNSETGEKLDLQNILDTVMMVPPTDETE